MTMLEIMPGSHTGTLVNTHTHTTDTLVHNHTLSLPHINTQAATHSYVHTHVAGCHTQHHVYTYPDTHYAY